MEKIDNFKFDIFVPMPVFLCGADARWNCPHIDILNQKLHLCDHSATILKLAFWCLCIDSCQPIFSVCVILSYINRPVCHVMWRYSMLTSKLLHNYYKIMPFYFNWGEWEMVWVFRILCNFINYEIGRNVIIYNILHPRDDWSKSILDMYQK